MVFKNRADASAEYAENYGESYTLPEDIEGDFDHDSYYVAYGSKGGKVATRNPHRGSDIFVPKVELMEEELKQQKEFYEYIKKTVRKLQCVTVNHRISIRVYL